MAVQDVETRLYTDAEFEAFVRLPENSERLFEFIDGEIVEVPSNTFSSELAIFIAAALLAFVRPRRLGHVTGENGGYVVAGRKLAPDAAFISFERQPELAQDTCNPNPPELAVEVISPIDKQWQIRRKLSIYAEAGVLVWLVYPQRQTVEVYAPEAPVEIVGIDGNLNGGAVLPGFELPLREIFAS